MRYCETIRSAQGDELMVVRACDVVRVRDGLIVSIDEYAIPQADPTPATATGYSRNQISFALNQVQCLGFFDYVNRVRVQHLLRQVPLPAQGGVIAWSELAGFRSASTFYKAFRQVTGQSPAEWLRQSAQTGRPVDEG